MEIIVTGKHIEVTDPIRDYAVEKVSKLPRYFDRVQEIEVIADKRENHHYEVEVIVHVEHHDAFVARSKSEDLYGCIDDVVDKMERQLTDHKERVQERKRQPSR